jgi:hypothetical protein
MVFALDFSELHTLLFPAPAVSDNSRIMRRLLEHESLAFTLPLGATVELLHQLRRTALVHHEEQFRIREFLDKPIVAALFDKFSSEEQLTKLPDMLQRSSEAQILLRSLGEQRGLFAGLQVLETARNLHNIEDIVDADSRSLEADGDILRQCLASLNFRRPGAPYKNNLVDAHNYATVWSLSKASEERDGKLFVLVTSSPIPSSVFRQHRWHRSPLLSLKDPHELPLVRHPIQVLYYAKAMEVGKDRTQFIVRMRTDLLNLVSEWSGIDGYKEYRKSRSHATESVRMPTSNGYMKRLRRFEERYSLLFSDVRQSLIGDLLAEENSRLLRAVSPFAVGARTQSTDETVEPAVRTRAVFEMFDKVNRVTDRAIRTLETYLGEMPEQALLDLPKKPHIRKAAVIDVKTINNEEFKCLEIIASFRETNRLYFAADIYADFYAIWWVAGVTVSEFLKEAAHFVRDGRSVLSVPPREKAFSGIYVYYPMENGRVSLSLEDFPDLDLNEILGAAARVPSVEPLMIRLGFDVGDLCYDIASFRGITPRIGVVSHLETHDSLAWLLDRTSDKRIGITSAIEAIGEMFQKGRAWRGK